MKTVTGGMKEGREGSITVRRLRGGKERREERETSDKGYSKGRVDERALRWR